MRATCYTSVGGRKVNEDALLVGTRAYCGVSMYGCETAPLDAPWVVVADGMGGHGHGQAASRLVVEHLAQHLPAVRSLEALEERVRQAKNLLDHVAAKNPEYANFGATVAGVFFPDGVEGERAWLFHSGDCRIYRRGAFLDRLTRDHSLVQQMVDRGEIDEEAMRTHPQKNVVTSALIGDGKGYPYAVEVREVAVPEKGFLLCSDGVWECLPGSTLEACVTPEDMADAAGRLKAALDAGHPSDNATFILCGR